MNATRWGILGPGWIAGLFTSDLLANGHTVTAVGSRSAEKASAFAAEHGIAKAHGSYEALVADPEVDAVYVATPHSFHLEHGRLAIAAGKHLLVEKPFTINARQGRELADLAAARGVVVLEAMWTRFLPHMVRLREILAAGTIGEVRALFAAHRQALPEDPGHRINDLALGGGALLDLGVYPVAFAFDVLGQPEHILASGRLKATGADAECSAIFRYANGASALLLCGSDLPGSNTAEINGSRGYIVIDDMFYAPTSFRVFDSAGQQVEAFHNTGISGRGMHFQAIELERLIAAGLRGSPTLPLDESMAIIAAMDEIRRQIGVRYPQDQD